MLLHAVYYLDTSALTKRYKTEKGTEVVDELFGARTPEEAFVTSHFTSVEIESTAARAVKGRILTKKAHGVLLRLFADDIQDQIIVLPVSTGLLSDAATTARTHALKAGDAVQLASAVRVKESAQSTDVIFVTSDKELAEAAKAEGLSVLNPESDDALAGLRSLRKPE